MNVQDIFNKVIESGHYSYRVSLMCPALGAARRDKVITQDEYQFAYDEIRKYLGAYGSLGGKLNSMKLNYEFNSRLQIYQNWENRPHMV